MRRGDRTPSRDRRDTVAGRKVWPAIALGTAAALGAAALWNIRAARRAERRNKPLGRFVDADDVRLHYVEKGSGTPVVLLSGNGAMAQDWLISDVFDRAAEAGFRVLAFDRPGYGWSERPRGRSYTPEAQAQLIRIALRRLGIERPVVVGHSWGAMIAASYALDFPDDTRGLVLISGYYFPTRRADVAVFSPPAIPVIGDVLRYTISPLLGRVIAPLVFRRLFAPRPVARRFREEFPLDLALRPSQIRTSAAETAMMIPAAMRLRSRYFAIGAPTVLMAGAGDRIVSPERQTRRLHRHVPKSVLYMVPGAGHMVHHLVPSQVVDAIRAVAAAERQAPAVPSAATAAAASGVV